jgi:hypothetical protein
MTDDRLADIEKRFIDHEMSYGKPRMRAKCRAHFDKEGVCGCEISAEADLKWCIEQVKRWRLRWEHRDGD